MEKKLQAALNNFLVTTAEDLVMEMDEASMKGAKYSKKEWELYELLEQKVEDWYSEKCELNNLSISLFCKFAG